MNRILALKDLTRFEQTLFGLPFLLSGALLSLVHIQLNWRILWIFPAFLFARISGMAFNQLIDRFIDEKNPRTKNRAIPSGRVSEKLARLIAWSSLFLFLGVCAQVNTKCLVLAPFTAFLLYIYSYLKRFTYLCHFVLGLIHFFCPVMASIAISNTLPLSTLFLGMAAALSIIGNDIAYALQDSEFDRQHQLYSFPARFGIKHSLLVARISHLLCLFMLIAVGYTAHLAAFYYLAVVVVGWNFYQFHKKIAEKLAEPLFFSCNVAVAFSVFGFILASVVWDVM